MKQQCPTPVSDNYFQALKVVVNDQNGKEDGHDVSIETEGAALVATPADSRCSIKAPEPPTSEPIRPHSVSSAPSGIVVAQPAPTKWSSDEAAAQADLPDVPLRFQRKSGSTGQIRPVSDLAPEVSLDEHSSPARSRTLDYSWKSC
jgi:hypothetical protein